MKTAIPSPARSQGPATPRRYSTRRTRSVGSPALSNVSGRLSTLTKQLKEDEMGSLLVSPMNRRSVLSDNTDIEMPQSKSWWKKLDETSGEIMAVLHSENIDEGDKNILEEYIQSEGEVLSQENKNYTLELPESSGSDTIDSIVLPQRKLFTHKENLPKQRFGKVIGAREALTQHQKSKNIEKSIHLSPKKIFGEKKRHKSMFPSNIDIVEKEKSIEDIETKSKKIFGKELIQNTKKSTVEKKPIDNLECPENIEKATVSNTKMCTNKKDQQQSKLPIAVNVSLNKTVANVSKEMAAAEAQVQKHNLFGNRAGTKRKNIFADFKLYDSEEDIPEIETPVWKGLQRKPVPKRRESSASLGLRDVSPTSSVIATDTEMDEWNMLPSSTMIADKLEDIATGTPMKKIKLSIVPAVPLENNYENVAVNTSNESVKVKSKGIINKNKSNVEGNNEHITLIKSKHQSNYSLIDKSKNISEPVIEDFIATEEIKSETTNKATAPNIPHLETDASINKIAVEGHHKNSSTVMNYDKRNEKINKLEKDHLYECPAEEEIEGNNEHVTLIQSKHQSNDSLIDKSKIISEPVIENCIATEEINCENTNKTTAPNIPHLETDASINKIAVEGHHKNPSTIMNYDKMEEKITKFEKDYLDECPAEKEIAQEESEIAPNSEEDTNGQSKNKSGDENDVEEEKHDEEEEENSQSEGDVEGVLEYEISEDEVENELEEDHLHECLAEEEITQEDNESEIEHHSEDGTDGQSKNKSGEENHVEKEKHDEEKEENSQTRGDHEGVLEYEISEDKVENKLENDHLNECLAKEQIAQEDNVFKIEHNSQERTDGQSKNKSGEENHVEKEKHDEEEEEYSQTKGDHEGVLEYEISEDEVENELEKNHLNECLADEEIAQKVNESEIAPNSEEGTNGQSKNKYGEENDVEQGEHDEEEENSQSERDLEGVLEYEISEDEVENELENHLNECLADEEIAQEVNESEIAPNSEEGTNGQSKNKSGEENDVEQEEHDEEEEENSQSERDLEGVLEYEISEDEVENDDGNCEQSVVENVEAEDNVEELDQTDSEENNENEKSDEAENESDNQDNDNYEQEVDQDNGPEEIADSPNITHDTTGRNRKKINETKVKTPEVVRQILNNPNDSITNQGRNTSIRKTKSMIMPVELIPRMTNVRDSIGTDGSDFSAQGSGWDSHRTTRKTLRQTFGKDFTPRKSLRALVMDKAAKRQTVANESQPRFSLDNPQANSTEIGSAEPSEMSDRNIDQYSEASYRHDESKENRLDELREKLKQVNLMRKQQMENKIQASLKTTSNNINDLFKVPLKPSYGARKGLKSFKAPTKAQSKGKPQPRSAVPLGELPAELIEELKYKPPKRFAPSNASWTTNRLYKYLESKLEPQYDYMARVRAERLMETLYNFTKLVRRMEPVPRDVIADMKHELARLRVVRTHHDFYEFFHEFMPREIRVKVVPDACNKYPLPRRGIFADIIQDNELV